MLALMAVTLAVLRPTGLVRAQAEVKIWVEPVKFIGFGRGLPASPGGRAR